MAPLGDLSLDSLRGGLDDTTPIGKLPKDFCTLANNVEFFWSALGERRYGCEALDIAGSGLDTYQQIVFLAQWFPQNVVTTPEIWAANATPGVGSLFRYRSVAGTWTTPTVTDALANASPDIYEITAQAAPASISTKGKLFITYANSVSQNREHVWDPNMSTPTLRRAGLPQPDPPTVANEGSGSISAVKRWYRIRLAQILTGTTKSLLSEPSTDVTITPSGTGAGIRVTRPTLPTNEAYTHWVVEGSFNGADFYELAIVVAATATYDDTQANPISFSDAGVLSDAIGAYLLIEDAKFAAVEGDRMVFASHHSDVSLQSTVWWTPVSTDPGIGNDERIPIVTTGGEPIASTLSLDNHSGGGITGMSTAISGSWYVFKWNHIYKGMRTNRNTLAYQFMTMSTVRGAIPGSIFAGADENGAPAIFFLDPLQGPSMISVAGLRTIVGVRRTWNRVNMNASAIIGRGVYYPYKRQAHWWVATESSNSPDYKLVLQVSELQDMGHGEVGRGWSTADGRISEIWSCTTITEESTVNGVVTIRERPFIGLNSPDYIQRCDSEVVTDDAGVAYIAVVRSAPIIQIDLLTNWGAMATGLLCSANPDTNVMVSLIGNFENDTGNIQSVVVPTDPLQSEAFVIKVQDSLKLSESVSIQVQFSDTTWVP